MNMDDQSPKGKQPLGEDFRDPAWIRGSMNAALMHNFCVGKRTREAANMIYLLELIYTQLNADPDPSTKREALHAGVLAVHLRHTTGASDLTPSPISGVDLQRIANADDQMSYPLTREMADFWLTKLGKPGDENTVYAQVLPAGFERGEWKRYNVLHRHLPLQKLPDVNRLEAALDREFPWLGHITAAIVREIRMAGQLGMNALRLRPLLLAGPPGSGKSRYARRLSELVGMPNMTLACAGSADSMSVRGTSRGWSSSRPGVILELLLNHESAQALVIWDELDKASPSSHNGRIWDVCLQLMERETAHRFFDEALEMHCDLSWVNHVATVNQLGVLPKPLLERFHVLHAPQPRPQHFEALLNGVIDDLVREYRLVDRRLLPTLSLEDHNTLRSTSGLNPRLLARAVRRLIAGRLQENTAAIH